MVKKKVARKKISRKKSVKKRVVKKRPKKKVVRKPSNVTKSDFETFKFGVSRLKELKTELDSMNTKGFEKEAQTIRSKLKTVSEIPNIERALKELKAKINGKYKPKRKVKSPSKHIKECLEDVQTDLKSIKKATKEKPQLRAPIDSGVDMLVDTNFNDFLNTTKSALSGRIKNKEHEIDETLKRDLEKRENKYKQKNDNLLKEYTRKKEKLDREYRRQTNALAAEKAKLESNTREARKRLEAKYQRQYDARVKDSLHKEVLEKFNKMLKQKFDAEKVKLGKEYKERLRQHLEEEMTIQKRAMVDKLNKDKEGFEMYKEDERKKMSEKLQDSFHKKLHAELTKKEKSMRGRLRSEYDLRLKRQIQEHEEEIKRKKLDLELEMQRKIKQVLN